MANLDPNRPIGTPDEFPIWRKYREDIKIGPFNWPTPLNLTLPDPARHISFSREEYAQVYNILTRYEYCAERARTDAGENWKKMKQKERYNAIAEYWHPIENSPIPNTKSAQGLLEKYNRRTDKLGALQQASAMLGEYYGEENVAPIRFSGITDFPELDDRRMRRYADLWIESSDQARRDQAEKKALEEQMIRSMLHAMNSNISN